MRATYFGPAGLTVAVPRIDTNHNSIFELSGFATDRASIKDTRIDHRPGPTVLGDRVGNIPGLSATLDIGLSASAQGVLGNLPARVQHLLTAPFSPTRRVSGHDHYWEGDDGGDLSLFVMYLAGAQELTATCGTRRIPVGHTESTAHWELTVYRAWVTQPFGKPWKAI